MEYIGLTEEEMVDVIINAQGELDTEKARYNNRLRDLGIREEEIMRRMRHFESTFLMRRVIAENNRRIAVEIETQFDERKKGLFL